MITNGAQRSLTLLEPATRTSLVLESRGTGNSTYESAVLNPQSHFDGSGCCRCAHGCRCWLRCCSWTSSNPYSQSGFSLKRLAAAYMLYVALGSAIFRLSSAQKWDWAQAFYYAMTTGLSIGYGAMQPSNTLCKVFAVVYIILGACAMTLLLSVFVRKLLNLVPLIAAEEWRYQAQAKARTARQSTTRALLGLRSGVAPKYRIEIVLWIALLCWIVLGTVWAREWQRWDGRPQWTWLTSLFFAVGTVTTAGMLGPEVDEDGKVPSHTAIFLAVYAIIGVPLFGATISHRASTYVEAQVRRQERENLDNRLSGDLFNAVRELRYGTAAARQSTRNTDAALQAAQRAKLAVPEAGLKQMALPPQVNVACDGNDGISTNGTAHMQAPDPSVVGDRSPNNERVLWGDFLALQLLRLRKVDFDLLKDLREEYLEMVASNQNGGGLCWSTLVPLLTTPSDEEDFSGSSPQQFLNSEMEAQEQSGRHRQEAQSAPIITLAEDRHERVRS